MTQVHLIDKSIQISANQRRLSPAHHFVPRAIRCYTKRTLNSGVRSLRLRAKSQISHSALGILKRGQYNIWGAGSPWKGPARLPLKDTIRSRSFPAVNWLIILANVAVFVLVELELSPRQLERFVMTYSVVPRELLSRPPQEWLTLFTSLILHGGWTHDYPIGVDEAKALGLPISTEMPKEVYQLMNLYPQAGQRRPSVDYIPLPYPAAPAPRDQKKP